MSRIATRRSGRRRGEIDLTPFVELIDDVNDREQRISRLDDRRIRGTLADLRRSIACGSDPGSNRAELFALTREASRRTLRQRLYDVQIIAGAAMVHGLLAEMRTGEGKTLSAVAPAVSLALNDRGVHVLTFNDYLARRDAEWMGPIYAYLGLTVGVVAEGMSRDQRRLAYSRDVTYVTAKEAGFDFLRDGLVLDADDRVQRPQFAAIVDEADSIMIDEARHPLVIAGRTESASTDPAEIARVINGLRSERDYESDRQGRNVQLTDAGIAAVEARLDCGELYAPQNQPMLAEVRNALHAKALLRRDVDYLVRDGKIELVDELTGRVVVDRLWPDGLQGAIEAKEGLLRRPEGRILGSITMQQLLGQYLKLTGMTATAASAAAELKEFYGLEVAAIPTHAPCIRVDHPDRLFVDARSKRRAVLTEIEDVHREGRPIVVGTASVVESENLADALSSRRIECSVLNAKNDEAEASIVAEAGRLGAVTISTNMAGRGTDIRLGGADERERAEIVALGGLHVVGINRHESSRIDDQLRGRAGRQGDPGSSRFFVSLEDDLARRYATADAASRVKRARPSGELSHDRRALREIDRAQRFIEGQSFEIRRTLRDYSSQLERQRTYVQRWRREVLEGSGADGPLERELMLRVLDRCWSDHLAWISEVRRGIHLARLVGKLPLDQFHRQAGKAFEAFLNRVDQERLEAFESLELSATGVNWEAAGLEVPASTWTYVVSDDPFEPNPMLTLANDPARAVGAVVLWPLLLVWGIWERIRRRKRRGFENVRESG